MLDRLKQVEDRFREIEQTLTLPQVVRDLARYTALMKEYKQLTPIMDAYRSYEILRRRAEEAQELMQDASLAADLRAFAEEEYRETSAALEEAEAALRVLLLPRDPRDDKNVVIEIRQGTGGEEAALFAADLFRMYSMYADRAGFTLHVISQNETELGGYKEITFTVAGDGAFSKFQFESGVHRVQRIPVTESNGRIQTSAVTVAVLPEAEEVEVDISPADVKFESCKSSGAGGQHINKTESAVRLTHKPSGIVIECDSERSQLQNKETAMRLLRTKLYDIKQRERDEAIASSRRAQVGGGDRSEKIRTYNFPQSRVTDHRIGKTLYSIDRFLNGDMDELLTELLAVQTADRLKGEQHDN